MGIPDRVERLDRGPAALGQVRAGDHRHLLDRQQGVDPAQLNRFQSQRGQRVGVVHQTEHGLAGGQQIVEEDRDRVEGAELLVAVI